MNSNLVSAHMFLYYGETGEYVLDTVSKFYNGSLYLSLVENNSNNDFFLNIAKEKFEDIRVVYVSNCDTDQYGFYNSFKHDFEKTPWIFYCHDKHPNKRGWLQQMLSVYKDVSEDILTQHNNGIISSEKYKRQQPSFEELLSTYASYSYEYRKEIVQSMHTLIWLHELEKILLSKYDIGNKDFKCPTFSAGNTFLIRRDVVEKSHGCVYEKFFNHGIYRTDGEVEHGLERFYFYVSQCLGYENIYI